MGFILSFYWWFWEAVPTWLNAASQMAETRRGMRVLVLWTA